MWIGSEWINKLEFQIRTMKKYSLFLVLILAGLNLFSQNRNEEHGAIIKDNPASLKNALKDIVTSADVLEVKDGVSSKELELTFNDMQWWHNAKFGLFIHWGVYSIAGKGEWYMFSDQVDVREYKKLADQFTAEKFDAKAWAECAKDAGMKYMVLTARHHDGFSLWDSPGSYDHFTSMNSAAKKDIVAEYTKACRVAGLRVGLYYSPLDWRFPGFFFPEMYRENAEQLKAQTYAQVEELMKNYGKIDVLWYDGGGDDWLGLGGLKYGMGGVGWSRRPKSEKYTGKPLYEPLILNAMVRQYQPKVIMNDRSGYKGDFKSREMEIGDFDNTNAWEKCGTMGTGWGYLATKTEPYPLKKLLTQLSNIVCRGGNFLLNVGPRSDGQIEPVQVARLKEMGQWLKQYGECIYGTQGGPVIPTKAYGATSTSTAIYIHIWEWPEDRKIIIGGLIGVKSGKTLTDDKVLISVMDGKVELSCDQIKSDNILTVIKLNL